MEKEAADKLRERIERQAVKLLSDLKAKQEVYFAAHGRYWQGLKTHDQPPKDGALKRHNLQRKPTDQAETWESMGLNIADSECSFEVSVYDGPQGKGYILTASVQIGDELWTRRFNVGPETYREQAWQMVVRGL